jgi:hypothetical protein
VSLTLTIETGGDAFADGARDELARLLRQTADRIEAGNGSLPILDYNGARCGSWEIDEADDD